MPAAFLEGFLLQEYTSYIGAGDRNLRMVSSVMGHLKGLLTSRLRLQALIKSGDCACVPQKKRSCKGSMMVMSTCLSGDAAAPPWLSNAHCIGSDD